METGTLQAFLRVLYTVNNNPQYILAKSSSQVPAVVCSDEAAKSSTNGLAYARASLRACLMAVCDSSPELLQDPTRDFSLYVLDPLEAQPLPASNNGSPHGVAVALGLMSWALESNDSANVLVTGTIVPNSPLALEVIFALREIKRMPKPTLHSYSSLGPTFAAGPSQIPSRYTLQASGMSWPSTSYVPCDQQEQRTLTRSADFPELYIGPPRRAPGRPEGSTSSKSKVKRQPSNPSILVGANSSRVTGTLPGSKQERGKGSKQKTKPKPPRHPPTCSPFICEPLSRNPPEGSSTGVPAFYQQSRPYSQNPSRPHPQINPQTQPCPNPTQHPLLTSLSAISSSGDPATNTTPEQQAALLSALQGLLATNPRFRQWATTYVGLSTSDEGRTAEKRPVGGANDADVEQDDADSDIVILDSSAIDTTVFRKPSNREVIASSDTDVRSLTTNEESPAPSSQDTISSPLPASTPPSGQEGTPVSSQTSTPVKTPDAKTPTFIRPPLEQPESGDVNLLHALDIPMTPTPSRMGKRKLDAYIQGQTYSSSPPSPSPSAARASGSARILAARQRVLSSPIYGMRPAASPSRLPSMLGSMRSAAVNQNRSQSTAPVVTTSQSKVDAPQSAAASSSMASDIAALRRRLNPNLNEIMEEHEARRNAKIRKRSPSGDKLDESANDSRAGLSRPSNSGLTLRSVQSSPPRPLFRSAAMASLLAASIFQSSSSSTSACAASAAPPSTEALTKNPLKNFVMPAWARTSTATMPRLSEEVLARQRAEQEAKKTQASLRRRDAARAKRKRLREADQPSKESSDEGEVIANEPKPRMIPPSSNVSRSTPSLPPPPPSLPVFASDAVAPIPTSPPRTQRQLAPPSIPSTPPRKPVSPSSAPHRTPNKSGSCSLFTPSGRDPGSLFTPSTPSATRSFARPTFTPRSPTVLRRSEGKTSPWKNVPQTPKRNSSGHHTPGSLRSGRCVPFASPSLAMRMPQMQTGMAKRAFLLPPPSPSTSRTPHQQNQLRPRKAESGTPQQESPSDKQDARRERGSIEDTLNRQVDDALPGEGMAILPGQQSHPIVDGEQGTSERRDMTSTDDVSRVGVELASSPLPPSSPLPVSPLSSPTKHQDNDSDVDMSTVNNLTVPDSDILLPSASDSDRPQSVIDTNWLSDDACAWLTETEAWLTDTEGGPLLTDSDGAWLSDSDAVFGDMSSLPPSNWFSDDADVDTDGEAVVMDPRMGPFDTSGFERAFEAFVERGERSALGKDEGGAHDTKGVDAEFWESIRPLLEGDTSGGASAANGDAVSDIVDEDRVAQDLRELLDGLDHS